MLDITTIRKDFPILSTEVNGRPLVYFDNAATTQKPQCVLDTIMRGYTSQNANIHRGVHFLSQMATEAHEEARKTVQRFINAEKSHEIVFTRGTTEAINLVASSFVRSSLVGDGDEIIISAMEHHSNIVPWQLQQGIKNFKLRVIPFYDNGELNMEEFEAMISERTKLVSVTHCSNTLGTVNPVREIIEIAHKHDIPVLIDGAQGIPHHKVDVQSLDADFYVFSGHKIYAPTGIGVLYGKEKWLDLLPPYQGGGEMIKNVSFELTTFNELPFKFEAGTPDYIGSTALASALDYVSGLGLDNIIAHERDLLTYATEKMSQIEDMRFIGEARDKSGLISFLVGNIHPYDMGTILDKLGIAVRTGHHCAEPVMKRFGIEGTVRASFGVYNTREEVDILVAGIERAARMFRKKK